MRTFLIAVVLATSLAAIAQTTPGPGPGKGGGCPGMQGAAGANGAAPCWNADTVPGWPMMSAEERQRHQERMAGMKTRGECQGYMEEHQAQMQARAKERGQPMPGNGPAGRGCDALSR